jgi:hypothetical protein
MRITPTVDFHKLIAGSPGIEAIAPFRSKVTRRGPVTMRVRLPSDEEEVLAFAL